MKNATPPTDVDRARERLVLFFRRPGLWAVLMGAVIFLPFLGLSGLWDPWETHYAEVARRMLVDGDWLNLHWRSENFFSKPIGIFWMIAASFSLLGTSALAARLPFALLGILGVWLTFRFVARLTDARRGLWCALVVATSPFYFILARQAITDLPFAVFLVGAMGCFLITVAEERPRRRDVFGVYAWAGLAALAKTPIGLCIGAAVGLAYLLLTGEWRVLRRLKLHLGVPLFLLIAAPWYVYISVASRGEFFNEFFLHHNVQRAFTGVHGERGTFAYYVEQLGYGFFPWVALLPFAFGRIAVRLRESGAALQALSQGGPEHNPLRLDLFAIVWFLVTFTAFSLIVTKFHHYIFPALVPLSVLVGLALADQDDSPGTRRVLLPIGVLLLAVVANDVVSSAAHITNLVTYAYDRPLPEADYPHWVLLGVAVAIGLLLMLGRFQRSPRLLQGMAACALLSALWLSFGYIARLGDTLGQGALFETFERVRKPGERIYQYQMNWRGEVFYSKDTIEKLSNEADVEAVFQKPGRHFIISVRDSFSAVDRAVRRISGRHLHLLPGSGLRYVLASNEIEAGVEDENPLGRDVLHEVPPIGHPLQAGWVDGIEFLGYDLAPEQVGPGDSFELVLYFRCEQEIAKNWKIFIHIDGRGHELHRINGDHFPIGDLYPTNHWMAGDIIRDRVKLKMPFEFTASHYTINLGFYIGETRLALKPGAPGDGQNRLLAGSFKAP